MSEILCPKCKGTGKIDYSLEDEISDLVTNREQQMGDINTKGQWRRFELLLRIVAKEAALGMSTGLDFNDMDRQTTQE